MPRDLWLSIQPDEPGVRFEVRAQVSEVHVMIAAREQHITQRFEYAGLEQRTDETSAASEHCSPVAPTTNLPARHHEHFYSA